HAMTRRIVTLEEGRQHFETLWTARHVVSDARLAQHADLPENQGRRAIELAPREEKIGRLEALTSIHAWVHAQISDQAVFGRDAGKHAGRKPRPARPSYRLVGGADEHARVAIERRADAET